jgi:hypothetical protein
MIYNIDDPTPEPIPFPSRRARRASEEGYQRDFDNDVISINAGKPEVVSMTRRELRKIERANEFLDFCTATLSGNVTNHARYPELPIISLVNYQGKLLNNQNEKQASKPVIITNQLVAQQDVITDYKQYVEAGNWDVINNLNDRWLAMQPAETTGEKVRSRLDRIIAFGRFASKLFLRDNNVAPNDPFQIELHKAAHRQHWLNEEVAARSQYKQHQSKKAA